MIEEQFPTEVGRTAKRTIQRNVVSLVNGFAFRQNISKDPDGGLRLFNFPRRLLTDSDFNTIRDFYIGSNQGAEGFLFNDWKDNSADETYIATGDASTTSFNLIKRYEITTVVDIDRRIFYPDDTTLRIFFDDVEQLSGFSWNSTTKQVDFSVAPGNGVVITASYDYDIPVTFNDELSNTNDYLSISDYGSIVFQEFIPDV